MAFLDPDRLLPADQTARRAARDIFASIEGLPIVSPHGHTDPWWFARNTAFTDAASLFLTPDHYVLRMLRSFGISYDDLGVPRLDNGPVADGRTAWRLFASQYHRFIGTPSQLWIDHALNWGFEIDQWLCADNADMLFDQITERLQDDDMRPRALLDRAGVEVIATTEFSLEPLDAQK